ncbi:hypothetical protein FPQ18DRAFT_114670 [Pyronema domesticum]|nr:hypothetical protein FPQ18DRAFT_114670 [Pyronema domesticum]
MPVWLTEEPVSACPVCIGATGAVFGLITWFVLAVCAGFKRFWTSSGVIIWAVLAVCVGELVLLLSFVADDIGFIAVEVVSVGDLICSLEGNGEMVDCASMASKVSVSWLSLSSSSRNNPSRPTYLLDSCLRYRTGGY